MKNKTTLLSCVLTALSGICFVTGVALLSNEGGAADHGLCEEINLND